MRTSGCSRGARHFSNTEAQRTQRFTERKFSLAKPLFNSVFPVPRCFSPNKAPVFSREIFLAVGIWFLEFLLNEIDASDAIPSHRNLK